MKRGLDDMVLDLPTRDEPTEVEPSPPLLANPFDEHDDREFAYEHKPQALVTRRATQQLFLKHFMESFDVGDAAGKAGTSRATVSIWKRTDEWFANEFVDTTESAVDALEARAYELAMSGDRSLIQFLLKGRRSSVYGDKIKHHIDVSKVDFSRLSDEQLDRLVSGEDPQIVIDGKTITGSTASGGSGDPKKT